MLLVQPLCSCVLTEGEDAVKRAAAAAGKAGGEL